MKRLPVKLEIIIVIVIVLAAAAASSQTLWSATTVAALPAYQTATLASSELINPEDLVKILNEPKAELLVDFRGPEPTCERKKEAQFDCRRIVAQNPCGASSLLRMSLLVGKTFRTFTDLLKHQFKPLEFF